MGIGLVFPTLMAMATADVPAGDAGTAGGLANTSSQAGGSIGLAVLATVAGTGAVSRYGPGLRPGSRLGVAIAALAVLPPRRPDGSVVAGAAPGSRHRRSAG